MFSSPTTSSSHPALAPGNASQYGTYGLRSSSGVPSSKSIPYTATSRRSISTLVTRSAESPSGFWRCGARVA